MHMSLQKTIRYGLFISLILSVILNLVLVWSWSTEKVTSTRNVIIIDSLTVQVTRLQEHIDEQSRVLRLWEMECARLKTKLVQSK